MPLDHATGSIAITGRLLVITRDGKFGACEGHRLRTLQSDHDALDQGFGHRRAGALFDDEVGARPLPSGQGRTST